MRTTNTMYAAATYLPEGPWGTAGVVASTSLMTARRSARRVARHRPAQPAHLRARILGGHLVLPQGHVQQRYPHQGYDEREPHRRRQAGARERQHAGMNVGGGQIHREVVERHERAGDDGEHAGVARLALGILD